MGARAGRGGSTGEDTTTRRMSRRRSEFLLTVTRNPANVPRGLNSIVINELQV